MKWYAFDAGSIAAYVCCMYVGVWGGPDSRAVYYQACTQKEYITEGVE